MSKQEAIALCKRLFAGEPVIRRVEAEMRSGEDDELEMDLTFVVEGDLYDAERRVLPLVTDFMLQAPGVPVDFMVLPVETRPEPTGSVVYRRV